MQKGSGVHHDPHASRIIQRPRDGVYAPQRSPNVAPAGVCLGTGHAVTLHGPSRPAHLRALEAVAQLLHEDRRRQR
eukprot:3732737-Heterocapsa_arctica.AAC.1